MIDQYFGIKELYEVVLRARNPMNFGNRRVEVDEPVLYFENISMSLLQERNNVIMARGGWSNMPRVIWEDRSEVEFTLSEGVISSISLGILLSTQIGIKGKEEPYLVPKREGPFYPTDKVRIHLQHWPVEYPKKKTFIFDYERDVVQQKIYGKRIYDEPDDFDPTSYVPCLELYKDKELKELADTDREYLIDYYYEYNKESLLYTIQKERFNGLFSLEGRFYSKDENDGYNYTNLIYMPKVRVVSDINLRLGERADPTVSVFNIIALPENTAGKNNLILEITRLNEDLDERE